VSFLLVDLLQLPLISIPGLSVGFPIFAPKRESVVQTDTDGRPRHRRYTTLAIETTGR
jgi:hypothetical protein